MGRGVSIDLGEVGGLDLPLIVMKYGDEMKFH